MTHNQCLLNEHISNLYFVKLLFYWKNNIFALVILTHENLLHQLFVSVFNLTSSPKIPDMAGMVMAEMWFPLEIIIVNHRLLESPGSIW